MHAHHVTTAWLTAYICNVHEQLAALCMCGLQHRAAGCRLPVPQGRLRANAEAVAFYRGVAKEGDLLRSSFRDVVQHQARVLGKQWRFGMVQVGRTRGCLDDQGLAWLHQSAVAPPTHP